MKLANKIRLFSDIILILLVFIVAFYSTFNIISPELSVKFLGFKNYIVLSNSMSPVINKGDMIIIRRFDIKKLKKGDIVSISPDRGIYITHYLAEIRSDEGFKIRTRSFGNESKDKWDYWTINKNQYLGKYAFKIPYIGYIFLFLKSRIGLITILITVILIYILIRIIKGKNYEKNKD